MLALKGRRRKLAFFYSLAIVALVYPYLGWASPGGPDDVAWELASDDWRKILSVPLQGGVREQWLLLNYYHEKPSGIFYSEIRNSDFFISKRGTTDPVAEFDAFRSHLANYIRYGEGAEVLCRFPARMRMLLQAIGVRSVVLPECSEYIEQVQPDTIESVSLVYASGYFDNPASYYGHTLLKLNRSSESSQSFSLDTALNYGADADDPPGNPLYIWRGLFGGYSATYSQNDYFLHSYLYTSAQLRDTWEYELQLSESEVDLIVEHSWEVRFAQFDYYFFSDNCAHRIARLVEVATGRDLSSTHGFWLQPIQVVRHLQGNLDEPSLIAEETYNASLRSRFISNYESLSRLERKTFQGLVYAEPMQLEVQVGSVSRDILRLGLDYFDLDIAKLKLEEEDRRSLPELQLKRSAILGELFARPPISVRAVSTSKSELSPLRTRQPSQLRLGTSFDSAGSFGILQYRIANNDFLEPRTLGQEVSRFTMGDVEIKIDDTQVSLNRLVLLDIVNLSSGILPKKGAGDRSWSMKVDYSSRSSLCESCKDFGFTARMGKAVRTTQKTMFYGLGGGRLHTQSGAENEFLTLEAEVGMVLDVSSEWILHLSARGYLGTSTKEKDWLWKADLAFNPRSRFDFRIGLESFDSSAQVTASAAVFFD